MNDSEKTTGSLALKPKPRIITIPATGQDLTRPLRVAAYARVSSDSNDQLHSYVEVRAKLPASGNVHGNGFPTERRPLHRYQ